MRETMKLIAAAAAGGVLSSLILTTRPVTAAGPASLDERVANLEKVVIKDDTRPKTALTDRVDAIEKSLHVGGPGEIKTPDDLKTAVLRLSIAQDDMDRRLRSIERTGGSAGNASDDHAVHELKSQVDTQARDIRDLQQKIRNSPYVR